MRKAGPNHQVRKPGSPDATYILMVVFLIAGFYIKDPDKVEFYLLTFLISYR